MGNDFVLDEVRNRFVYPGDSSLVIYFQWEAPPGDHVLTGIWKQPDGRTASISADVKVQTTTNALNCYWIFTLTPGMQNGVWTLEVRVDGQPGGTHPFEIAGMETKPAQPTVDQIFKTLGPSLVWIRKIDSEGRRSDPASGFVIGQNRVVTAFQTIDSARGLEVEFADGHKFKTDRVAAVSRTGDWAVLEADTGSLAPLQRGNPKEISVGGRLLAFNVDSQVRVIGGVDIGGQSVVPGFGGRIQLAPAVATDAVGGPLLDLYGRVVGVLGGSTLPGARLEQRLIKSGQGLAALGGIANAATPVSEIPPTLSGPGKSLAELEQDGTMTPPLVAMPEFLYGGMVGNLPKRADDPLPADSSEFSRHDTFVNVYSFWKRQAKISKGELSATICDMANHLRGTIPPKKVSLRDEPTRFSFGFSPGALQPGMYRIDLLWDGRPAWRTFVHITE